MAERKRILLVQMTGKPCSRCSGGLTDFTTGEIDSAPTTCQIAKLKKKLKRPPTEIEVSKEGGGWFSAINIPDGCPNGYRSPENRPLR